ncbi:Abortive infection protein [Truepera radiovictrix DSM 17093]|uniref:Abortive infection protein n=1 Tax=Truepera radiovictrix (strain DSM 17093 / CIP 108686 / LMG 22925 / RQ-24) TaxID=649638 RepID=D7CS20_TRURR|nr:Abortive infection protein [Truepera radiovictrix DSM 17093]
MRAARTWPGVRGWGETLLALAVFAALALPLGRWGGLLEASAALPPGAALRVVLRAFFVPSALEEILFRVLPPPRWALPALGAYVLTHPLNALFVRGARDVFLNPLFLLLTLLLGALCSLLYRRTGSLWPPVVLHWAVVSVWLPWGGAAALG